MKIVNVGYGRVNVLSYPKKERGINVLYDYGLEDSFRKLNPTANDKFSWFDYRSKGFDDNRGLRIDHILVSQKLAERCVDVALH